MRFFTKNSTPKNTPGNRGADAEARAAELLKRAGLTIRERNFKCRAGEIDIIAVDRDTLVFVEVRLRTHAHYSSPLESVTPGKQTKIRKTAQLYLQQHKLGDRYACRFDVIGIDASGPQWIKNAFY